ncbi:mechanosensitive ion channel [Sulfurimonas gotlandica GD1]|uniref:Mechanosensitive ion channel n=1 Tax=Sulfurimonas gotlandica (strain DSM 19862 / JCM 16533 / GD1) TaxID=929558 RepID=B6BIE2_SULGG|nr:mechanosensitive ion channel family protein [Sulfurimonas gotlandica]EDZ63548.1 small-conductance mechanosensitive channel [Sulfurimonas gotlandica GD1]EHP30295.1 mechanosensitive ion channel [Sulfurimonas gotlandica GD1]
MDKELEEVNKFYNIVIEFIANYSFQILGALIIIIIGIFVSRYVQKFVLRVMINNKIDETLSGFVANFVRFLVVAIMAILALGKLGISIAPFIAALGAISLTAGLALQGSVSNFAAGIVLVLTKPFKIGDTITVHDVYGEVEDIKLSYTSLRNEDGEQITIPNKYMIGDVLVNSFSYRVVEGNVGVAYDSDVEKAISTIKDVVLSQKDVSSENEPIVGVERFNDSSVDIAYRYWAPTKSFFKTQYDVNIKVLKALNSADITIPFPQREIRVLGEDSVSK